MLQHLPKPPAAKLTSQGDAHVRTNAQIKFLYYSLFKLAFMILKQILSYFAAYESFVGTAFSQVICMYTMKKYIYRFFFLGGGRFVLTPLHSSPIPPVDFKISLLYDSEALTFALPAKFSRGSRERSVG